MESRPAHMLTVTFRTPGSSEEIPELCDDAADVLAFTAVQVVRCDVGAISEPDATTLDAVARLALVARRMGARVELFDACPSLVDIVDLAGLADVIEVKARSGVEVGRQPEQGEQGVGVEEEVELDDLAP